MSNKIEKLCQACADGELRRVTNLINGSIFSQKLDIDIKSNNFDGMFGGMTPLMCASMYGQSEVVIFLLKKGANVNAVQSKGNNTALIYALANNHLLIANLLIEANADASHRSNNNKTAISIAEEKGFSDILNAIKQKNNETKQVLNQIKDILKRSKEWGTNNRFPLGKEYPQYEEIRNYGKVMYKEGGINKLKSVYQGIKDDGSDLYTYLDLLWNHLDCDNEKDIWLM